MTRSATLNTVKLLAVDLIAKVLYWPVWWYTVGLLQLLRTLAANLIEEEQRLGVGLWWRNLLVPMYGQYDWQGRMISFFMRLVVGVVRTLMLLVWLVLLVAVLLLWVAILPTATYFGLDHLGYYFEIG